MRERYQVSGVRGGLGPSSPWCKSVVTRRCSRRNASGFRFGEAGSCRGGRFLRSLADFTDASTRLFAVADQLDQVSLRVMKEHALGLHVWEVEDAHSQPQGLESLLL
jgi:hypothetical protein